VSHVQGRRHNGYRGEAGLGLKEDVEAETLQPAKEQ
jgi:hypothetical protein